MRLHFARKRPLQLRHRRFRLRERRLRLGLRSVERRFQRRDPLGLDRAGRACAGKRIDRRHQFGQAILGDLARAQFVPGELALAAQCARIVAPQ